VKISSVRNHETKFLASPCESQKFSGVHDLFATKVVSVKK